MKAFDRSPATDRLMGALLGCGGFSLLGLLRGKEVAGYAIAGGALGLVLVLNWQWQGWRTDRYRSQHDPPGPTLTWESLPRTDQLPAVGRHGAPPTTTILLLSLLAICVPIVIVGSVTEEPAWAWLVVWVVFTVLFGALLWTVLYTYTEVGPDGIRLNKPFRSQMIRWSELAEVGWVRDRFQDVVMLSTVDGRRIRTVGVAVSPTGVGLRRALRMLADIEKTWAASE